MNLDDRKIAIIGLGYVGLPLAVEFGKRRPVVGFDIRLNRIEEPRGATTRRGRSSVKNWQWRGT